MGRLLECNTRLVSRSLDQSLRDLVMQGKLSRSEAIKYASHANVFENPATAAANTPARPAASAADAKKSGLFSR